MFLKHLIPSPFTAGSSSLGQCLVLAVLLHIWTVLMFGNATGTARPGDGVWGRLNVVLNVKLAGSETGSAAAQPMPPLPEVSTGPMGRAKQQRFGGSVRPIEDPARQTPRPTTPGAAELGNWQAQRVEQKAEEPAAASAVTEAPPGPAAALTMAPPPTRNAVTRARPAPMTGLSPEPPLAAIPLDQSPLPQARVMVMEAAPAAAITRAKAEEIGRVGAVTSPPKRLTPALITANPLPAEPQFKLESLPAPLALPARVQGPVQTAAAAEPVNMQLAAPTELSRQARNEVEALAPRPPTLPMQATALAPIAAAPSDAATVAATPSLVPALPSPGLPEAGSRLGQDVATPASVAVKPPPLNLNLPRARGGELSSRGSSGVLQLLPAPPERKSKLSEEMEKAAKEDCRKAYGETLGLLAVVPLALDAARSNNKGCRW